MGLAWVFKQRFILLQFNRNATTTCGRPGFDFEDAGGGSIGNGFKIAQ